MDSVGLIRHEVTDKPVISAAKRPIPRVPAILTEGKRVLGQSPIPWLAFFPYFDSLLMVNNNFRQSKNLEHLGGLFQSELISIN